MTTHMLEKKALLRSTPLAVIMLAASACARSAAIPPLPAAAYDGAPGCVPQPRVVPQTGPLHFEYEVQSSARPAPALARVAPPDGVAARPARATLLFVVDTAGRVEPSTVTVIKTTDTRFAEAACRSLSAARFVPARRGGAPVRMWYQSELRS